MNTIVQQIITCTDVMMTPKPSSVFRASFFLFMKNKLISFVWVGVCVSALSKIFVSFRYSYFSWDTSFSVLQEKLPQVSEYLKLRWWQWALSFLFVYIR